MPVICPNCYLPQHLVRHDDDTVYCTECSWSGEDDDLDWEED